MLPFKMNCSKMGTFSKSISNIDKNYRNESFGYFYKILLVWMVIFCCRTIYYLLYKYKYNIGSCFPYLQTTIMYNYFVACCFVFDAINVIIYCITGHPLYRPIHFNDISLCSQAMNIRVVWSDFLGSLYCW
jgi:hypothetical protein